VKPRCAVYCLSPSNKIKIRGGRLKRRFLGRLATDKSLGTGNLPARSFDRPNRGAKVMSEPPISRGFFGRRRAENLDGRLPPGQHLTTDFPVLSAGPTPTADIANWTFSLSDGAAPLAEWSWTEFAALPQTEVKVDIHCVTTWSKFDTVWRGVTVDALLEAAGFAEPPAPYALIHCTGGYTTNVPVEDMLDGKAMVATHFDGRPLAAEHGGPARLLVPHLYFWKSAKWATSIQFIDDDEPGFWEQLGYHIYGDPWREQRYAGD
jgi:DMSO/TMAO reductase YedYZ molybdopterin-dependent catalytic subunit